MEGDQQPATGVASPSEGQSDDRPANQVEETDNQPQMIGQVFDLLQALVTRVGALENRLPVHDRGT